MIERRETVWAGKEKVSETFRDVDWVEVRETRNSVLKDSDVQMLADRYAQLTDEQKTELTEYRQALRDLTDYETSNEAADHFPVAPTWFN